jgi:hypothetical protein
MNKLIELWERPPSGKHMIAGWHQWADAGDVSSGLPRYLIERTQARKIGRLNPDGFYLFQVPGMHHLLRPVVKLHEGHRESLGERRNEFFHAGDKERGFLIFLGLDRASREYRPVCPGTPGRHGGAGCEEFTARCPTIRIGGYPAPIATSR